MANKTKDNKPKMETSKILLFVSYFLGITLAIIVVVGTFTNFDMGNVTTLACTSWAEIGVANAFYYKKAAKENVPKIINSFDKEMRERIDVNNMFD